MAGEADNYFNLIRNNIKEMFIRVKRMLDDREKEFLTRLDKYQADFMMKTKEIDDEITFLTDIKSENDFLLSKKESCYISESMHTRIIGEYEGQITALSKKYPEKHVSFMWNDELANQIGRIGYLDTEDWIDPESKPYPKINKNSAPLSEAIISDLEHSHEVTTARCNTVPGRELMSSANIPKLSVLRSESNATTAKERHQILSNKPIFNISTEDTYLIKPKRMSCCPDSGRIFITDMGANCVKVYTRDCRFEKTIGMGKLVNPFGICVWNAKLFITHEHSISIYSTEGALKQKYTSLNQGSNSGELLFPQGLDVAFDGNIYICDGGNNRVQIMGQNLEFKGELEKGRGDDLNFPTDVKTTQKLVLVLDSQTICVHVFSIETRLVLSHIARKGLISRFGEVKRPTSLALINSEHFVVCDSENCLVVFKISSGNLKKVIKAPAIVNPSCVAVDGTGSILAVCERVLNGLVTCNFNM